MADGGRSKLQEEFQEEDHLSEEGDVGHSDVTPATAEPPADNIDVESQKEEDHVEQVTLAAEHLTLADGDGDAAGEGAASDAAGEGAASDAAGEGAASDAAGEGAASDAAGEGAASDANRRRLTVLYEKLHREILQSMAEHDLGEEYVKKQKERQRKVAYCFHSVHTTLGPDPEEDKFNPNKVLIGRIALGCLRIVHTSPEHVVYTLHNIRRLSLDENPCVRTDLMEHVPYMAMFCESRGMQYVIDDHILLWVLDCVSDPVHMVRRAAVIALMLLIEKSFIKTNMVEEKVCPAIVEIPIDDEPDDEQLSARFMTPTIKEKRLQDRLDFMAAIVKMMCRIARRLGPEKTEQQFLEKFCSFAKHSSDIGHQICASHFVDFALLISQSTVKNILLPILVQLCEDKNCEVRRSCAVAILSVSCIVSMEDRRDTLAPAFVKLLNDRDETVHNEAYVSLGPFISTFADPCVADIVYKEDGVLVLITKQGCELRLNKSDEVSGDHSSFHPRDLIFTRSVSTNTEADKVAEHTEREPTEREPTEREPTEREPAPLNRGRDPSVEGTSGGRKRFNRSLPSSFFNRSSNTKFSLYNRPCSSSHKPVQNVVPAELLDAFLSMSLTMSFPSADVCWSDLTLLCAYNVPAVARTLGGENWLCLREIHLRLSEDYDPDVRRTVASSLHVIANIVGEIVAVRDLVPIFIRMIEDVDDFVKMAALRVLADFLREIPKRGQIDFLPKLKKFFSLANDINGHLRQEWAHQINILIDFFEWGEIIQYLQPLVLNLLKDRVAEVRTAVIPSVCSIFLNLAKIPPVFPSDPTGCWEQFMDFLKDEFGNSSRCERRLTFARLCCKLFALESMPGPVIEEALPLVFPLANDPVVNVRIAAAKALTALLQTYNSGGECAAFVSREEIVKVLMKMQREDGDDDVRYFASFDQVDR